MKSQKTDKDKESRKADPFSHFGDFQKMAEMMKHCCPDEGGVVDCCSMMRKMMGRSKGAKAEETNQTEKSQEGGNKG